MPPEAKIAWFEDDKSYIRSARPIIEDAGHEIISVSHTIEEARQHILSLIGWGVQVAIVDGNLSDLDFSGADGMEIASAIKLSAPNIVIIGNATRHDVVGAEIQVPKMDLAPRLAEAITNA